MFKVLEMADEAPAALVKKPRLMQARGTVTGLRSGRGFSLGELRAVGLSVEEARKLGVPIDKRRRSSHEWNIKVLQEYLTTIKSKRSSV